MTNKKIHNNNTMGSDILPMYRPLFACEIATSEITTYGQEMDFSIQTVTGLFLNRLWIVGTLTSYEPQNKDGIIRIADPTGVLSLQLKKVTHEMIADPSDLIPPLFLSITAYGEKISGQRNEIRWIVETLRIASREERDSWILITGELLITRLQEINTAILAEKGTESLHSGIKQNKINTVHLKNLAVHARKACDVIKESAPPENPTELILSIIREYSGPKGLNMDDIFRYTRKSSLSDDLVKDTIRNLIAEDEVYQPSPGYVKLL